PQRLLELEVSLLELGLLDQRQPVPAARIVLVLEDFLLSGDVLLQLDMALLQRLEPLIAEGQVELSAALLLDQFVALAGQLRPLRTRRLQAFSRSLERLAPQVRLFDELL